MEGKMGLGLLTGSVATRKEENMKDSTRKGKDMGRE